MDEVGILFQTDRAVLIEPDVFVNLYFCICVFALLYLCNCTFVFVYVCMFSLVFAYLYLYLSISISRTNLIVMEQILQVGKLLLPALIQISC